MRNQEGRDENGHEQRFTGARTTQMTFFRHRARIVWATFGPSNELQRSLGHGVMRRVHHSGAGTTGASFPRKLLRRRKSRCSRSLKSHDGSHRRPEALLGSGRVEFESLTMQVHSEQGPPLDPAKGDTIQYCVLNSHFKKIIELSHMNDGPVASVSLSRGLFPCDGVAGEKRQTDWNSPSRSHPPGSLRTSYLASGIVKPKELN